MRGKRILINPVDDYCDLKGELIMSINKNKRTAEDIGCVEYKMPEAMAKEFLKNRSGDEKKMRPNDYLCKIVNETFCIRGRCINVILY